MRTVLAMALLTALVAGCLSGEVEDGSGRGRVFDGGADVAMHAVADDYYDVADSSTYIERGIIHLGGGTTSGALRFHTWEQVEAKLTAWNETYPRWVDVVPLTTTHGGRTVWHVVVTDETVSGDEKKAAILDGAHHGNEYAGGELMLYSVDMLLENLANATVRAMLSNLEVHVVPVLNPDGWVAATRYNGFGVNLNRNYDIDWGNVLGTSNPVMGEVGAATGQPVGGVALVAENCGASAFSEPETQAMRDLFAELGNRTAFYFTGHTPSHAVIAPWAAFNKPFDLPAEHARVLDAELDWIRSNTEYEAGHAQWGDLSAGLPYAASGSSMDYFYAAQQKPAFTVEVEFFELSATSEDYPARLLTPYDGLRYWMDATVAIPMHLLANWDDLGQWKAPSHDALLPEDFAQPRFPRGLAPAPLHMD